MQEAIHEEGLVGNGTNPPSHEKIPEVTNTELESGLPHPPPNVFMRFYESGLIPFYEKGLKPFYEKGLKPLPHRLSDLFPRGGNDDDDDDDHNDFEDIFFENTQKKTRSQQKDDAMKKICNEFPECGDTCRLLLAGESYGLSEKNVPSKILEIANTLFKDKNYCFQRFERLAVCNVLYWQHKLVAFDEGLRDRNKRKEEMGEEAVSAIDQAWKGDGKGHDLNYCLGEYCECTSIV